MNHSKKHSSAEAQVERHEGMLQTRSTVTAEDLPQARRWPFDTPVRESLGCEGDSDPEASIPQGVSTTSSLDVPVFVKPGQTIGAELIGRSVALNTLDPGAAQDPAPSPTPAEPEKTAPAPDTAPRFGIWSDGVLAMRIRAGFIELEADEFDALVNFLDRVRKGGVS